MVWSQVHVYTQWNDNLGNCATIIILFRFVPHNFYLAVQFSNANWRTKTNTRTYTQTHTHAHSHIHIHTWRSWFRPNFTIICIARMFSKCWGLGMWLHRQKLKRKQDILYLIIANFWHIHTSTSPTFGSYRSSFTCYSLFRLQIAIDFELQLKMHRLVYW